ncbi:hypothetical protein C1701_13465 [Actinoalloteichus sp. AHMU CJ021]|uniref:Outer membrane channel protein CpnT-like N-terminal domain-containing protein n=2 Tax=Actinoalloteichus cyanogriseus TaxID=2893586 RepID=A0ABT1JMG7_ACTCY|nr:WXG100 family type VII secretion target [Actinoalloteichus caeruleus]AUS79201.1 hypothetical protein C1701_13465 [Actinoalloteichus sp. AHMU CJ021]MCP2333454.1 hypothetical protein [Actinoalloteichus caeruleus DSM 43889]
MFPDRYPADPTVVPGGVAFDRSPGFGGTSRPASTASEAAPAAPAGAVTASEPAARPPWLPQEGAVGGPDGDRLAGDAAGHLGFLSWISDQLGVPDPVHEYFGPVVGRWSDMHEQAEHWRAAARRVEELSEEVAGPLGGLDEAWTGDDADSFVEHVQEVTRAANAMADTMTAVADALDVTADAIRQLVRDMVEVLAGSADSVSEALTLPVAGEERARDHLATMREPLLELFEAVREVLRALVGLCSGLGGDTVFSDLRMAHVFPEDDWSFDVPSVPGGGGPGGVDVAGAGTGGGAPGGGGGAGGVPSGGGGPGAGSAGAAPESEQPVRAGGTSGVAAAPGDAVAGQQGASTGQATQGGRGMGGGAMMGGGMMGGGAQQNQGDQERKNQSRIMSDASELFGEPEATVAPVIGEDG